MLKVKQGVVFKVLMPQVLVMLDTLHKASASMGVDLTITSANDGASHKKISYHYKNLAIDIRDRNLDADQIDYLMDQLRGIAWGQGREKYAGFYDIVHEKKKKHIHAEFDMNRWNKPLSEGNVRAI